MVNSLSEHSPISIFKILKHNLNLEGLIAEMDEKNFTH